MADTHKNESSKRKPRLNYCRKSALLPTYHIIVYLPRELVNGTQRAHTPTRLNKKHTTLFPFTG